MVICKLFISRISSDLAGPILRSGSVWCEMPPSNRRRWAYITCKDTGPYLTHKSSQAWHVLCRYCT